MWRGKWIIITVTLCAVAVTGLISFFVLDPVYESSTVLAVSLPEEIQTDPEDPVIAGIVGGTPQAHIRLLQDPVVLQRVGDSLPTRIDAVALAGKVGAKPAGDPAKGDKLVEIVVKDREPETARVIADAIVAQYVTYLSELVSARLSSRKETLSVELAEQEGRTAEASGQLEKLLESTGGADLLRQEIKARSATLANCRWEDAQLSSELQAVSESLRVLEQQLKGMPQTIPIVWTSKQGGTETSPPGASATAYTADQINPAYTSLLNEVPQKRANLADLKARIEEGSRIIPELESEIARLTTRLVEQEMAEERLRGLLQAAEARYLELARQLQTLEGRRAETIVRSAVGVAAPATTPTEPSGPRKLLNMVVSGMLGLMVSVFAVFVMHYWHSTQPKPATTTPQAVSSH